MLGFRLMKLSRKKRMAIDLALRELSQHPSTSGFSLPSISFEDVVEYASANKMNTVHDIKAEGRQYVVFNLCLDGCTHEVSVEQPASGEEAIITVWPQLPGYALS